MVQKSGNPKPSDKPTRRDKDSPMASYEDRLKAVLTRKTQIEEERKAAAKKRMLESTLKHQKLVEQKRKEFEERNQHNNSRIASVLQRKQEIMLETHARKVAILRKVELRCIKAAETKTKTVGKVSKRKTSLSQAIFHQLELPKSRFNMGRKARSSAVAPKRLVNSSRAVAPKSPVPMSPKRTRSASGTRAASSASHSASNFMNDPARSKTLTRDKKPKTPAQRTSSKDSRDIRKSEPLLMQKKSAPKTSLFANDAKNVAAKEKETSSAKTDSENENDKSKKDSEIEFYKQKMAEHRRAMREKMNATKAPQSAKIKVAPSSSAAKLENALDSKLNTKDLDSSLNQILSITSSNASSANKQAAIMVSDFDDFNGELVTKDGNNDGQESGEVLGTVHVTDPKVGKSGIETPDRYSATNSGSHTPPNALEEQKLTFFEKEEKFIMDQEKIRQEAEKEKLREQEEFERMQEERRKAEEQERAERRARLEAIMKRTRTTPTKPTSGDEEKPEQPKPEEASSAVESVNSNQEIGSKQEMEQDTKLAENNDVISNENAIASIKVIEEKPTAADQILIDEEKSGAMVSKEKLDTIADVGEKFAENEVKPTDQFSAEAEGEASTNFADNVLTLGAQNWNVNDNISSLAEQKKDVLTDGSQDEESREPESNEESHREVVGTDQSSQVENTRVESSRENSREHSVSPEPVVESASAVLTPSEENVKSASLVRESYKEPLNSEFATDHSYNSLENASNDESFVPGTNKDYSNDEDLQNNESGFFGLEDSGISLDTTIGQDTSANDLLSLCSASTMPNNSQSQLPTVVFENRNQMDDNQKANSHNQGSTITSFSENESSVSALATDSVLLDFSDNTSKKLVDDSMQQLTDNFDKFFTDQQGLDDTGFGLEMDSGNHNLEEISQRNEEALLVDMQNFENRNEESPVEHVS